MFHYTPKRFSQFPAFILWHSLFQARTDMHAYHSPEFTEPLTPLEEGASSPIQVRRDGTTRQCVVRFAHVKVYFVVCRGCPALPSHIRKTLFASNSRFITNMGTIYDDAAKTYATPNAPYLRYLNSIQKDWQEAKVLLGHLTSAVALIPTVSDEYFLQGGSLTIAQILDISVSTDDQGKSAKKVIPISNLRKRHHQPPTNDVEEFLRQLRSCGPNIDTRIVVLHREWTVTLDDNGASKAAATLLFCHILGMELGLRPSDVSVLARIIDMENKVESFRRHPQHAGYVSLGSLHQFDCNSIAASLGMRKFQGGSANLGTVHGLRPDCTQLTVLSGDVSARTL